MLKHQKVVPIKSLHEQLLLLCHYNKQPVPAGILFSSSDSIA